MMSYPNKLALAIKRITPRPWRLIAREYLSKRWDARFEGRPVNEIFSALYQDGRWGRASDAFYSGPGSHDPIVVSPYVAAVGNFLRSLPSPPSAVDLGCGDFNIGRQLRPCCHGYVACDIVPGLIEQNRAKFADMQVDFRLLNIIDDELPEGDVVFLRQVLQHLSNEHILRVMPKLSRYRYLVLTEHVPIDPSFYPNLDQATGGGVRLRKNSGVVLTEPPFLLRVKKASILCTMNQTITNDRGQIKTILYELRGTDRN